jgi:uncharacterized metal-binding protein YceD (DUF177 family)
VGKFDKYKVDLKGMQADTEVFDFVLDNLFFSAIDEPEVQRGKVNVHLRVRKGARAFELDFHTEGTVIVACDRCLDDMEVSVESDEKLLVKLGATYGEEGANLIVVPEADGFINVAWLMYEFVSLAVPMRHIHPPGKCNKGMTGKLKKHLRSDGNDDTPDDDPMFDGPDEAGESPTDPRWDGLKNVFDNN